MLYRIAGICLVLLIIAIRTYQQDDFAWIDQSPKLETKEVTTPLSFHEEVSTPPTSPSLRGSGTTNNNNQGQSTLFKLDFGEDVRQSNRHRASLFTIDVGTDLREVSPDIEEHFNKKMAERAAYLQRVGDEIFWNWMTLSISQVVILSILLVLLQLVIIKAPMKKESKCRIALWIISNLITSEVLNALGYQMNLGLVLWSIICNYFTHRLRGRVNV